MECIEARALKASFLSQMTVKATSQVIYNDDVWCLTGINGGGVGGGGEEFPVEDLLNLDFSEKDFQEGGGFFKGDEEASEKGGYSRNSSSTFSGADDFDRLSNGELTVPVEDFDNLEWLSQFVEDSTAEMSLLFPAGTGGFTAETGSFSGKRVDTVHRFRAPFILSAVPRKSRSRRPRFNRRPWSMASPPLSSAGDSSSTSSSSHTSSSGLPPMAFMNDFFSSVEKPPLKKQKRKPECESGMVSGRRCTHCQVQKTPQWRTGPLGPKTLCNACGVRFKSGRLYPEYRPVCSPTFSLAVHSNSHRKVLEMRRKKEMTVAPMDCTPVPVPSPANMTESVGGLDVY